MQKEDNVVNIIWSSATSMQISAIASNYAHSSDITERLRCLLCSVLPSLQRSEIAL